MSKPDCSEYVQYFETIQTDEGYTQVEQYYYLEKSDDSEIVDIDNLIITGHSLGGHLAGILGITVGKEATIFNAPGYKITLQKRNLSLTIKMERKSRRCI